MPWDFVVHEVRTMTRKVLSLALHADVDPRTARKALRDGPDAVRGRAGERLAEAMAELGLASPNSPPPPAADR